MRAHHGSRMDRKQVVRFILLVVAIFVVIYLTCESWWYLREHSCDRAIQIAATQYEVSPYLVKAVVWRESKFRRTTVGGAGEIGLMQVTLPAAKEWAEAHHRPAPTKSELFKVPVNLEAGTWYLGRALGRYRDCDDPVPFALAEYNAGRSNVLRWMAKTDSPRHADAFIAQIGFASTHRYVRDVMAIEHKLRQRGRL